MKQKLFLISCLLISIINHYAKAQSCNLSSCSLDLRNPISGLTIDSIGAINQTTLYYRSATISGCHDVYYGAEDCSGGTDGCDMTGAAFKFAVYYPKNYSCYSTNPLPVIVYFHPGGFKECSNYKNSDLHRDSYICTQLALRGFVVYNFEYRRGVLIDPTNQGTKYTSVQQNLAIMRAYQDARGAVRYVINRQDDRTDYSGDAFQIDTTKIFLAGASAGAAMVLGAGYYQSESQVHTVAQDADNSLYLGGVNQDYYEGDINHNFYTNGRIIGVCAMWGGVYLYNNTNINDFFGPNIHNPPLIGFVGGRDPIYPPDKTNILWSPNSPYTSTNLCLNTSNTYNIPTTNQFYKYGLHDICAALNSANIPAEFYEDCGMGHGIESGDTDTDGYWGTGDADQTNAYLYMVQRTATFFQAILNNKAQNIITRNFIDCKNSRNGCNSMSNNNSGCSNSDKECSQQ